jgi:ribosomal protein S18 acetylase RimI-like enzyme
MERDEVRAAFDAQIRRRAAGTWPDQRVEHDGDVVRALADAGGWAGVRWSGLTPATADAAIAAQISRFAELGQSWEWKHYSYDLPADLPRRLVAAGLSREPDEALLVAEIRDLALPAQPPPGVRLRPVRDPHDVDALVSVHDQVFGGANDHIGRALRAGLAAQPPGMDAVLAVTDEGVPIAAGRVEFHHGAEFASIWGGGTIPGWRGRGVFRALVAHRADLAAARGFRYLQVDASPESEPILRRLGFVRLATTTPFVHPATGNDARDSTGLTARQE